MSNIVLSDASSRNAIVYASWFFCEMLGTMLLTLISGIVFIIIPSVFGVFTTSIFLSGFLFGNIFGPMAAFVTSIHGDCFFCPFFLIGAYLHRLFANPFKYVPIVCFLLVAQVTGATIAAAVCHAILSEHTFPGTIILMVPRAEFSVGGAFGYLIIAQFVVQLVFLRMNERRDRSLQLYFLYSALTIGSAFIAGSPMNVWSSLLIAAFYGSLKNQYIIWLAPLASLPFAVFVSIWLLGPDAHFTQ